jgi:hypothetical protein
LEISIHIWFINIRPITVAGLLVLAAVVGDISARLLPALTYQDLFEKSDFVVIANPTAQTQDTSENSILRGTEEKIIGVETKFETQAVLKGAKQPRFVLHHYRLVPSNVALVDGPAFISFDPKHAASAYILFLVREKDGRFAPTAGQMDLDLSVQEMRSPGEIPK